MSSRNDYNPQRAQDGLRRRKRSSSSENQSKSAKIFKKSDGTPAQKQQKVAEEKIKEKRQSSCGFSGEPLTKRELYELLVKFTRDRHFSLNPRSESPSSPVVSRTTDGGNKNVDPQRVNMEENIADSLYVTVSNPLPNATGSTMTVVTGNDQYVSSNSSNINVTSTITDNRSNVHHHYPIVSSVPPENMSDVPSNHISPDLASIDKSQLFFNNINHQNSEYNNFDQFYAAENHNETNSRTLCIPTSSSRVEYVFNATNVEENHKNFANNNHQGILNEANVPSMQYHCNNYQNFNVIENPRGSYQMRENNMASYSFPAQNQKTPENSQHFWSIENQVASNPFDRSRFTVSTNSVNAVPRNVVQYVPATVSAYHHRTENVNNNCFYEVSADGTSTMVNNGNQNLHPSSSASWNGYDFVPNPHETVTNQTHENRADNLENSTPRDAEAPSTINDEDKSLMDLVHKILEERKEEDERSMTNGENPNDQPADGPDDFSNDLASINRWL